MGKASNIDLQMFFPECLKVIDIAEDVNTLTIHLKSQKHSHRCPNCGKEMRIYHATYIRTVQERYMP